MVIRMDLHRRRRLHRGEAHQHQQDQESSRELAEYSHTQMYLGRSPGDRVSEKCKV